MHATNTNSNEITSAVVTRQSNRNVVMTMAVRLYHPAVIKVSTRHSRLIFEPINRNKYKYVHSCRLGNPNNI